MSPSGLSSAATERMLVGLLRALAVQAVKALDGDLTFIEWQTTSFAREHEKLFAELDRPASGETAELCERRMAVDVFTNEPPGRFELLRAADFGAVTRRGTAAVRGEERRVRIRSTATPTRRRLTWWRCI